MDSFDVSLAQHRKALAKYMEEWTHQQELLMARYVAGTAHAPLENVICEREEDLQKPAGVETNSPKESGEPIGERRTGSTETLESIAPVSSFSQESSSEEEVAAAVRKKTSIEHSRIRKVSKEKSGLADDSALESGPWPALKSIVESSRFMVVVSVVIVCNVIFMAITSDLMLEAVKKNEDPNRSFMNGGEAILTCAYVSELLLKLAAYGKYFFVGREWRWNLFDLFIVLAGLSDLVAPLFAQGATINVYYLRVSRIFRLIKMLRVVKFYRAFKELRLIIESILGCLKTMFWTVTLLTTVKFLISLFFIQGVTDYLRSHPQSEWDEGFIKYWGSTSIAMVSLFQSTTGGEDWSAVAEPLSQLGGVYYFAFMVYICFFMFVIVNVLTGLFVDAALNASTKDDAFIVQEHINNREQYVDQMIALYRRLQDDAEAALTLEEFERGMDNPTMAAFFAALGIEVSDTQEFFRLMSSGGREAVDIEEFVIGCMKLKGAARSIDVVSLLHRTAMLEYTLKEFGGKTDDRFRELQALLSRLEKHHQHAQVGGLDSLQPQMVWQQQCRCSI